jgi:ribosome assembly protein SQT1
VVIIVTFYKYIMSEKVFLLDEPPIESDDDEEYNDDDNMEEDDMIEQMLINPSVDMSMACFAGHTDSVYCCAIHPTRPGVVITGGGDDKAYIWTYANATEENITENGNNIINSIGLYGHSDTVSCVGFNFDGTLALTGGYDGVVIVWKVDDGSMVIKLEGPEDIEWAEWHSKGNAIIAGSRDGTAWMWLSHNGQCVQVFAGHDGGLTNGLFTSDGKHICTTGEDGTVRVWAPKTGVCKHVFQGPQNGHEEKCNVTCLSSSNNGELLLSGNILLSIISESKLVLRILIILYIMITNDDNFINHMLDY